MTGTETKLREESSFATEGGDPRKKKTVRQRGKLASHASKPEAHSARRKRGGFEVGGENSFNIPNKLSLRTHVRGKGLLPGKRPGGRARREIGTPRLSHSLR